MAIGIAAWGMVSNRDTLIRSCDAEVQAGWEVCAAMWEKGRPWCGAVQGSQLRGKPASRGRPWGPQEFTTSVT